MEIKTFRKKTEEVMAIQWDGTSHTIPDIIGLVLENDGIATLVCVSTPCPGSTSGHYLQLHTNEGPKQVAPTDWIIRSDVDHSWGVLTDADRDANYEDRFGVDA